MVGKRAEKRSSPVASSQRWSTPCSAMRAAMARLTTSRGASSSTKRSPSRSRRSAPWPRSASESSGRGMAGWCSAVGWNCTNSTSAVGTPARSAMATPSPVDSGGLVVTEKSWPAPPVASTTWSARTSTGPSPAARAAGPARPRSGRPRPGGRARTSPRARRWPSGRWRRPGRAPPRRRWRRRRRARRAAGSGPPRGPAPAGPWPRGRTRPRGRSARARGPGPSSTRMRTASSSHRPAPAASVSARCRSVESSSAPSTAATPPWAQRVADCDSAPLVSTPGRGTATDRPGPASRTAADRPATPLPRTRTSKGPGRAPVVTPVRSA